MVSYKTKAGVQKHRIYVGWDDIVNGERCDGNNCPITRAIYRNFNHPEYVITNRFYTSIGGFGCYDLCKIARKFIEDFDDNKKLMKPVHIILTKL